VINRTGVHLFFGPNAPGVREAEARTEQAHNHARANDPANAIRQRGDEALRDYPDRARRLAARGLPVAPPAGYEANFELRALAQRAHVEAAEARIADALRPAARGSSPAARLARAEAELAELRRPMNFAVGLSNRSGGRSPPPSRQESARAEVARMRFVVANGLAHSREEASRIIAATEAYDRRGPRSCFT
jgi:hypothetical protein